MATKKKNAGGKNGLEILRTLRAQKSAQKRREEKAPVQRGGSPYSGSPLAGKSAPVVGAENSKYKAFTDNTQGVGAGLFLRAFAASEGDFERTKSLVQKWVTAEETPEGNQLVKVMTEGDFDSGGSLVQTQYSNDLIQLLRNVAVIRKAGARTMPMEKGNMTINKIVGGSLAAYRGEGAASVPSGLQTAQMVLTAKELVGLVPISNRLLRHSSLAMDAIVRDDLVNTIALKEDATFIRSDGTQNTPKGLRYLISASNIVAAQGGTTPTLAQVRSTLGKAVLGLKSANIQMINPCWVMAPSREEFLINVLDANGNAVYEEEMLERGTLKGIKYLSSNQIFDNLGGTGDESEIYLVDFNEVFIGEDGTMELQIAKDVTYALADGSLRSAFSNGETIVQATQFHDLGIRYDKAGYVITQNRWTT